MMKRLTNEMVRVDESTDKCLGPLADLENMTNAEREIFLAAINKYGSRAQITMLFEEMAELQDTLCKYLRGREDNGGVDNDGK